MSGIGGIIRYTPRADVEAGAVPEPLHAGLLAPMERRLRWRGDREAMARGEPQRPRRIVGRYDLGERGLVDLALTFFEDEFARQAAEDAGLDTEHPELLGVCEPRSTKFPAADGPMLYVAIDGEIDGIDDLKNHLEAEGFVLSSDAAEEALSVRRYYLSQVSIGAYEPAPMSRLETAGRAVLRTTLDGAFAAVEFDTGAGGLRLLVGSSNAKPLYRASPDERTVIVASSAAAVHAALPAMGVDLRPDEAALELWTIFGVTSGSGVAGVERVLRDEVVSAASPTRRAGRSITGNALRLVASIGLFIVIALAVLSVLAIVVFSVALAIVALVLLVLLPLPLGLLWKSATSSGGRSRAIELDAAAGRLHEVSAALADTPPGAPTPTVLLSGGVGSAIVAASLSRHAARLATIHVRLPDTPPADSDAAARLAHDLNAEHAEVAARPEPARDLVEAIRAIGVPLADPSLLPAIWLARAAEELTPRAYTGDADATLGDDERRDRAMRLLRSRLRRGKLRRTLEPPMNESERAWRERLADRQGVLPYQVLAVFPRELRRAIFGVPGRSVAAHQQAAGERLPSVLPTIEAMSMRAMLRLDTAAALAGVQLRGVLAELELSPTERLTDLRTLGTKLGVADAAIASRGLRPDTDAWFRDDFGGLRSMLAERLSAPAPFGIAHEALRIDLAACRAMLAEHDRDEMDHGPRLYALLVLALWAETLEA